ncbi:RNA 3'-terminal phosphate cyclase [Methanothrix sp.]|jgi:RNA 3'-terminal phosphate cyclase (ATP)|uniref:RNA 3'-terminal phosphate cyclase n=1 Tax=Methanothrix sp. TaxID=90426 RepID=UPI0027AF550D|nr:3-terminal phosphate cyclase [Euryarchaeota archaeon]
MIEIDGSFGEGGGQIVRTAVALCAVTGKSVHIIKIRQGRPRPGLAAQHAHAIHALAGICQAKTSGIAPGSSEISFSPGKIQGGIYEISIGTAGSITLLLQCLFPALLQANAPTTMSVQGGTDVLWSPTVDYFRNVFLPALKCFGAKASLKLEKRGYYPQGQGKVVCHIEPSELQAAHLEILGGKNAARDRSKTGISGISHCSNLPEHVAKRQADAAAGALQEAGFEANIAQEILRLPSTGSGITLWSDSPGAYIGASSLGKRGLPAEKVGKIAAEGLAQELASGTSVDVHLADQLIPYLALAGGSYSTREISLHTSTNIWTAEQFLERKISISQKHISGKEVMVLDA